MSIDLEPARAADPSTERTPIRTGRARFAPWLAVAAITLLIAACGSALRGAVPLAWYVLREPSRSFATAAEFATATWIQPVPPTPAARIRSVDLSGPVQKASWGTFNQGKAAFG